MRLATMLKTPNERLDYDVLFYKWLKNGDRLDNVVTSVSIGATVEIEKVDIADKSLKFWLKGGDKGEEAMISFTVTTKAGRAKQGCFKIKIRDCCS